MKTIHLLFISLFLFSITVNAQSTQENPMTSKTVIGYLKIPDIEGESNSKSYKGQIEIYGLATLSEINKEVQTGRGRARARATVSPISIIKKIDAATPYLLLANLQGKSFDEVVITLVKAENKTRNEYFTITLKKVTISKHQIDASTDRQEITSLNFEEIIVKYVNKDGEHEVSFDIAAGA